MKLRPMKKVVNKSKHKPPENILIIISTYQSDDILQLITKLQKYGHNVRLVLAAKFHQKKNREIIELSQKEIEDELTNIYNQEELKPTIIITDNEIIKKELVNFKKPCIIYSLQKATSLIIHYHCETLKEIKSETNFTKIIVNYNDYPRNKANIYKFMKDVPRFCLFFTAFGYYRRQYNFKVILKSFHKFLERQDKIFGNTVMLALGGNFSEVNDEEYFNIFYERINGHFATNVILLRNISAKEKKAFLRLSYAMLYFNQSGDPNPDVRLAMSVGTPLIGINDGFIKNVIGREPLSGFLVPMHLNTIVNCMYSLTSPTTYQKASTHSRLNYLKYFTKYSIEMEIIELQTRKKNREKQK